MTSNSTIKAGILMDILNDGMDETSLRTFISRRDHVFSFFNRSTRHDEVPDKHRVIATPVNYFPQDGIEQVPMLLSARHQKAMDRNSYFASPPKLKDALRPDDNMAIYYSINTYAKDTYYKSNFFKVAIWMSTTSSLHKNQIILLYSAMNYKDEDR